MQMAPMFETMNVPSPDVTERHMQKDIAMHITLGIDMVRICRRLFVVLIQEGSAQSASANAAARAAGVCARRIMGLLGDEQQRPSV